MRQLALSTLALLGFFTACTPRTARTVSSAPKPAATAPAADLLTVRSNIERDIRYLASDELRGRDTGSPEIDEAAEYIAEAFRAAGAQPVPGADGYFHPIALERRPAVTGGSVSIADATYAYLDDFVAIHPVAGDFSGRVLYFEYGTAEEMAGADLSGALVVVNAGGPEAGDPNAYFAMGEDKRARVQAGGGIGLIELFRFSGVPWAALTRYFGKATLGLTSDGESRDVPHVWIHDPKAEAAKVAAEAAGTAGRLDIDRPSAEPVPARNVLALVPGTDPRLREQYVLLGAHYDHVGVDGSRGGQDSIFNGARDNAIGTAALLQTARALAANPPMRSVIFAAWTAEEKGLLGSEAYAKSPLIPLASTVFNLNMDGAGYDDTTSISVIGLGRTSVDALVEAAAAPNGLRVGGDPAPEQGLYDRSDNVNFAAAGVPAINVSPGATGFTDEILKYYHQAGDEADSLDFDYLARYTATIADFAARLSDAPRRPAWTAGDKYEAAGDELYGASKQ